MRVACAFILIACSFLLIAISPLPLKERLKPARENAQARPRRVLNATPEERRARHKKEVADELESRNEEVRGRDLVAEVLSHSNPKEMEDIWIIREVLFNHFVDSFDAMVFIQRLMNKATFWGNLERLAALPDGLFPMPALIDVWKFVYCDMGYIKDGGSVNKVYEAQLREEELQSPLARAKELIRNDYEKASRRNAKWIIPVLERLSPQELSRMDREEEGGAMMAIWEQVAPPPPAWIQAVVDAQQPWGFVFYKDVKAETKFGRKWERVWEIILDRTCATYIWDGKSSKNTELTSLRSIHCRGHMSTLRRLWKEDWATLPDLDIVSDDDALRRHFREYRETLSSPSILRNTFLVVDSAPMTINILRGEGINTEQFWLWAYDADWEPTDSYTAPNGEVYQGRMKVLINSLDAWFYAARYEGVSLRDMWLKSHEFPGNVWKCDTIPLEPWKHQRYV